MQRRRKDRPAGRPPAGAVLHVAHQTASAAMHCLGGDPVASSAALAVALGVIAQHHRLKLADVLALAEESYSMAEVFDRATQPPATA